MAMSRLVGWPNAAAVASGPDPPRSAPRAAGAVRAAKPAPASPARPRKVRRSVATSEDRVDTESCSTIDSPRHRRYTVHVSYSCVAVLAGPTKAKLSPGPGRDPLPGHLAALENLAFDPPCTGHYLVNTFATEPIPVPDHEF